MADAKAKDSLQGFLTIATIYAICAGVYSAWVWIDKAGYRTHNVESTITAQGNWIEGETKKCTSEPLAPPVARESGKPNGYVLEQIACDGGPEHNVKIQFYGQEAQPQLHWSAFWDCKRNSLSWLEENAFTCRQTGGM